MFMVDPLLKGVQGPVANKRSHVRSFLTAVLITLTFNMLIEACRVKEVALGFSAYFSENCSV